jgi:hypothetical protein
VSQVALDFAVIGAQEAGIAAVAHLLGDRREIELTGFGERASRPGLIGARRLHGAIAPKHMRGWHGITTATIAARLALTQPDIKLIALLRDPLERARSQHQTARARARETRSFEQAACDLLTADGLAEGRFLPDEINTYLTQSEYGRILGEYLRHFPVSALHVELTSDIEHEALEVRRRLLRFLGVAAARPDDFRSHVPLARGRPPDDEPIADDLRQMLVGHFAADAELLRAITGLEVPWRAANPKRSARPIAVYTAITGGKDTLETPETVCEGCDYICFTDNPYLRCDGWQLRPLELLEGDPCRQALRPKLLAHRYLPEYASSVWVDANVSLRGDPAGLVARPLALGGIAVCEHTDGRPRERPAPATEVIASRHEPDTNALREAWWAEIQQGSRFDELALGAVLWRNRRSLERASGNGLLIRRRPHAADLHAASIRLEIESARTVHLSFPKAGRSWVCYFLARYVAERTGGPFDLDLLAEGGEIPPIRFLHEHADVFGDAPSPARLLNRELLMQRRIIVLVRDPRDSLVSYWHQKRVREQRPVPARLELFADCPVYGIERISHGTALLLDLYDRHPGEKLLASYEDLVRDPERRLREILLFALDGRPLNERCFRRAAAACSFERMREWERGLTPEEARDCYANRFGAGDRAGDDAQFKVRRGEVGGFQTELSPELQRRVVRLPRTAALLERLAARAPAPELPSRQSLAAPAGAWHDQLEVPPPVGRP